MKTFIRPKTDLIEFERALEMAELNESEYLLINYIRFAGTFTQPSLTQALKVNSKPPILSILCQTCRKIGSHMPDHFEKVRTWSEKVSADGVRWDGNLICSIAYNIDGLRLAPEEGTTLFHTFSVHSELFNGL